MYIYKIRNMYRAREEWYKYLIPRKYGVCNRKVIYRWVNWCVLWGDNMKKPSEVLKEKQWIQYRMYKYSQGIIHRNSVIGCCMLGAIDFVSCNGQWTIDGLNIMSGRVESLTHEVGNIATWNDMEGRTKEEVIAMLQKHGL